MLEKITLHRIRHISMKTTVFNDLDGNERSCQDITVTDDNGREFTLECYMAGEKKQPAKRDDKVIHLVESGYL